MQVESVVRSHRRKIWQESIPDKDGQPRQILKSLTTFEGGGGPRFWFSVTPQLQQLNYAQIIIELYDKEDTPKLIGPSAAISQTIAGARVDVRQLQTNPVDYPVELRVTGLADGARVVAERGGEQHRGIRAVVAQLGLGWAVEGGRGLGRLAVAQGSGGRSTARAQLGDRIGGVVIEQSYGPPQLARDGGRVRWPLRVAVISDVHSNLPALEAVLEAIEAAGIEEIWCLGDVVGYGAEPDACPAWSASAATSVWPATTTSRCSGGLDVASFSDAAAAAVDWTRANARRDDARVPAPSWSRRGRGRASGFSTPRPRDPIWEYVLSVDQAEAGLDAQSAANRPDRPLPCRPLLHAAPDRARGTPAAPRPATAALLDFGQRRLADQPGQRRAAARRRPARGLAGARHRGTDRPLSPGRLRRRRGRRGDRRRRPAKAPRRAPRRRHVSVKCRVNPAS